MKKKSLFGLGLQLVLWSTAVLIVWRTSGLFGWLGVDYGFFWAATRAFLFDSPVSAYDLQVVATHYQGLSAAYRPGFEALQVGPTPYPPIFVLLFVPFVIPDPVVGYVLWTLANLALAIHVVRQLAARFPRRSWLGVALPLTFFPLAYTLFVGQMNIILLYSLYQAYTAFEKGDDFRGGLWAGVLLLKPQYAIVLALVILFKRRWQAVRGLIISGMALFMSSLLILGPDGLLKYLASLGNFSGFRDVHTTVYPHQMINWRAVLVNFFPEITEAQGVVLVAILAVLTTTTLVVVWRGPWNPNDDRFASQMMATMIVTLLVALHSHTHGATLLLVPGMVMLARRRGPLVVEVAMRVSLFAPVTIFASSGAMTLVASILIALMLLAFLAITLDMMTFGDRRVSLRPAVQAQEST